MFFQYKKPYESLKYAIDEIGGLGDISSNSMVALKPNIVAWNNKADFPKYGVITTARMIEDIVLILSEYGIQNITLIDGIYSLEYGPTYIGDAHRSNLIIVSKDMISADKVGAKLLGYDPDAIPHIALSAYNKGRPLDLSDIKLKGNVNIGGAEKLHKFSHERNEKDDMPLLFEQMGIKGITFPNVDDTICTYCAVFINYIILGILLSKNVDKSFDDIEILYGKIQEPSGRSRNTLLVGQCQVNFNGENPAINKCHVIRGCPPSKDDFINVYSDLGIELPDNPIQWIETSSEFFLAKYAGQPAYEETFYQLQ